MEQNKPELSFTSASEEILRLLIHSKEFGNVVGICSPALGAGIFITAVENISLNYEVTVQLKPYDVTGLHLNTNSLRLSDIKSACAFHSKYEKVYRAYEAESQEALSYY
ncbi:hypothetical protein [Chryseosolibacter indicus]|uniref:Uncharacterized protein n=1 Tax=Chryseosolibacter indicus TaxID=2782351 RepID=A0ABS5VRE9_9BACT|nr:hypothetical protein [Chryseosolibacter indicus]MBT1703339.1 hypothetical protein [Chryseosolibacter indicus]